MGLDITSVLLNPYKMAATYPFCDFFLSKNHINARFPRDTLWIERLFSISTNFTFELKTWLNRILSIYILIYMIYLRSCSNLLIGINPRFLPPERWIHIFYPSSIMYYIHYNLTKKGFLWKQNRCRVKSTFIHRKDGGCKNKNPHRIVSFKSHVAFYHSVSNEVLP